MKRTFFLFLILFLIATMVNAEPERNKGLSVHFGPESALGDKSGFMVSQSQDIKSPSERPVLDTPQQLIEYLSTQSVEIQNNGLWVITTDPTAYSESEMESLEILKKLCIENHIPLYFCRGMWLPNGWIMASQFSLKDSDAIYEAKGLVKEGWQYFYKRDFVSALEYFDRASSKYNNFAPAYFGKAYVFSVQNKLDNAIEYYKKTIELAPDFSNGYSNLGLALLYSNKPDEAEPMLKESLKIDPGNPDAHVNMALYYFGSADYTLAWHHIHKAQDLNAQINPAFIRDLEAKMPEPQRK